MTLKKRMYCGKNVSKAKRKCQKTRKDVDAYLVVDMGHNRGEDKMTARQIQSLFLGQWKLEGVALRTVVLYWLNW
jgi:hypothetical protein